MPVFILSAIIYFAFSSLDLYGVALAAIGMLGNLATGLTIDAYGKALHVLNLSDATVFFFFYSLTHCLTVNLTTADQAPCATTPAASPRWPSCTSPCARR
jgi:hypothetical protein